MKRITSRHVAAAMLVALFCLLGLFALCCLGGCKSLDNYDRSYSLQLSDGDQSVAASAAFKPNKPYAQELRVPPRY